MSNIPQVRRDRGGGGVGGGGCGGGGGCRRGCHRCRQKHPLSQADECRVKGGEEPATTGVRRSIGTMLGA